VNIPHWVVITEYKFLYKLLESTQRKIKKERKDGLYGDGSMKRWNL
jgi:hypothetical protein